MIISIFNLKNGMGKTTTAINLACSLAEKKKKVLLIDFDPQADSTNALGICEDTLKFSGYDFLKTYLDLEKDNSKNKDLVSKFIVNTGFNIDFIPNNIELAEAELTFANALAKEFFLSKLLSIIKNEYDYILIDCPSHLALLNFNAIAASDYVIIPICGDRPYAKIITQILQTFSILKYNLNPKIKIMGFLITKFDQKIENHKSLQKNLKNLFEDSKLINENLFKTVIRKNVELEKAQANQKPINFFNRKCNGFTDYINLADEVINYSKENKNKK